MRVKVCGLTRKNDVILCERLDVNAIGFILAESPRRVSISDVAKLTENISPFLSRVAVVVNPERGLLDRIVKSRLFDYIQFHGNEDPELISDFPLNTIKSISIRLDKFQIDSDKSKLAHYLEGIKENLNKYSSADYFLFDTKLDRTAGGTGKSFNWNIFEYLQIKKPFILAGGLGIENIEEALKIENLSGVDLNSKLESTPGVKDREKLIQIMEVIKKKNLKTGGIYNGS
ncbi:MAG: phosphoribosylanthranilate isomerase [Halanaerobiales bacterium]